MDRILQALLSSKSLQKVGIGAGGVLLVMYVLATYFKIDYRISVPVVAAIILAILAYNVFLKGAGKKKASSFEKGLTHDASAAPAGGKMAARAAQKELVERWTNAVKELKQAGMTLYDLPWYLLIGEPQSGKSTTLKKSGLEFPVGTEALSGAGGTRNCDWWFTNEAVILDTAGRFAFQEKEAPDAAEWKTFLSLLRKRRPRCPINGLILVIPCSSLLGDSPEVRDQKAVNIREKLTELQRVLGIQFPVFVLITKSDQMLGFTQFFSRVPVQDQRQMLGWSMHGPFIQSFDPEKFNGIFDTVTDQVHRARLKILSEDMGLPEVDKLFVFPEELKLLRDPLREYLRTIFMKNSYLPALFFRGFYFSSGMQEGKPIAKACAAWLGEGVGGSGELIEELGKTFKREKAFFVQDFYKEKLFPERNLIVHSAKQSALNKTVAITAIALSLLVIAGTVAFCGWKLQSLKKGIGEVKGMAGVVAFRFLESRHSETSDLPDLSDIKTDLKPLGDDTAIAVAFQTNYGSPDVNKALAGSVVLNDLRTMHWMFVMNNLLSSKGEELGRDIGKGQHENPPAVGDRQYEQYCALWSANYPWLSGMKTEPLTHAISYLTTSTGGSTWNSQVNNLPMLIANDKNLPKVWLPLLQPDNGLLKTAVDQAIGKPLNSEDLGSLLGKSSELTSNFEADLAKLNNIDFGCYGQDSAGWETQVQQVLKDIDGLTSYLGTPEMLNNLQGLSSTKEDLIRNRLLENVKWADAAESGTEPKKELNDYINRQIENQIGAIERNSQEAGQRLKDSLGNYVEFPSCTLRPELSTLRTRVGVLRDLIVAGNTTIQSDQTPSRNEEEGDVTQKIKAWDEDDKRKAADPWVNAPSAQPNANQQGTGSASSAAPVADAPASAKDAADPLKSGLLQVANKIGSAAAGYDDAVMVQSWLAYAKAKADEGRLEADAPTIDGLKKKDAIVDDASGKLADLEKKMTCPSNADLLKDQIHALSAVRRDNATAYVRYWKGQYDAWEPLQWLASIQTWEELKNSDNSKKLAGLWLDVDQKRDVLWSSLNDFYSDSSLAGDGGQEGKDIVGKLAKDTLKQMIDDFVDAITQLPPNKDEASLKYPNYAGKILTLSQHPKFPEADIHRLFLTADEVFANRIAAFLKQWESLENHFPFAGQTAVETKKSDKAIELGLNPPAADPDQIKTFFLGPQDAVSPAAGSTSDAFQSMLELASSPDLKAWPDPTGGKVKRFIGDCSEMSKFLFDKGDYREIDLSVSLPNIVNEIKRESTNQPFRMFWQMSGKEQDMKLLTWQLRSETPDVTQRDFKPSLPLNSDLSMVFNDKYDKTMGTVTFNHPFSLLAQAWAVEEPKAASLGSVSVPLPNLQGETGSLTIQLKLSERNLPPRPNWDDVREFLKSH